MDVAGPARIGYVVPMRGLSGLGPIAIVAIAIAGCGGGGSSSSASTSSTGTSSASTSATSTPPAGTSSTSASSASLNEYLVHGNEEPGYAVQGAPIPYKTAAGYANSAQDSAATQQLTRAGFQQALVQNTGNQNGISLVIEFATAAGATREQSVELATDLASQGGQPFRFSVHGVPDSDGFGVRPVAGQGDANVLFREGRCLLLVGDESAPHPSSYQAAVTAGVRAIYTRTNGHGPCAS